MTVATRGLSKRFATRVAPAVADVDFEATAGGITTLLGPSGAGKSTVLRLIAGLERPDAGSITIEGRDVTGVPPQRRDIGFVFQSYALFRNLTVRRNVAFGLEVRHVPRRDIEARVAELLRLIQLEEYADRYPAQLSGGQRQRVAFARALAPRPKVLLLDEPFGALDARVRIELRAWLEELHRETGVTTILVTHDQDEALELSHQVVVMNDGRVVQSGPPQEIYDHPATPFVARFVGGANVLANRSLVRPHDVKLSRAPDGVAAARISHVRRVGGYAKLAILLPDGDALDVEMSAAELRDLGVGEGDAVLVDLHAAKVFVEDYAI